MSKKKSKQVNYVKKLGINLVNGCVPSSEIDRVIPDRRSEFYNLLGIHTCSIDGLYKDDVEAVFQRMFAGRLTGSQLIWD